MNLNPIIIPGRRYEFRLLDNVDDDDPNQNKAKVPTPE